MPSTFPQQFKTVFGKNLRLSIRTRSLLRQLLNLVIMFAIIVVLRKTGGSNAQTNIPIYMSIAIMLFCRGVSLSWVSQKQTKQAEVQRIMGVSNSAYLSGWLTFFIINGVFLSVVFIALLNSAGIFDSSKFTFGTAMGLYVLYMVASFSFVLFLSTFFSDAILASQIITFVQIFGAMLYFLLNIQGFRQSMAALQITALLPSVCFEYTLMNLGLSQNKPFVTPFTSTQGYITLGCQAVIYFILFIYLQLVLPNSNGSHLHPLFFLDCFRRKQPKSELQQTMQLGNLTSARYFQQNKEFKKISLYLRDLKKTFDEKVIVNNISLSLFEREIFCLLGHNGAGKTTTINMLTGLLRPDSGTINILGIDYSQMHKIRGRMGVCLQSDVLYDDLTVREQAQYYARLKGVEQSAIQMQVDSIMQRCGLQDQQNKRTKELSGGNKRKTCLACAAIGNSEIIFLDEPSSGLDPNSRKIIWQLIHTLKAQGRTIVLTTHHLEQAEALANRIGILAHGQLLVLGSCYYIKERFGCGYYLQIALKKGKQNQKTLEAQRAIIRKTIKESIANTVEDEQVGQFSMRFLLPINQQMNYSKLFAFLQNQGFPFSLKLSSLEDIFIRIGMDPTSILTNDPLPQLQKVDVPDYKPHYSICSQWRAVFIKKFRTTVRSFSVFTSILLPVIFITVGVVIAMLSFNTAPNQAQALVNIWLTYYTISNFMSLAFSFTTASYCGSIVRERQIKFKYLSCVMGMKRSAYWLGTISFDLLMFCLPFAVLFLVIGCFPSSDNSDLVSSFGWLALTLIFFSFSFLSFTYLWSFAFDVARTAYRFYPFMVFIIFFVIPSIPVFIVPTNNAVQYILAVLSPLMALNSCMVSRQMLGDATYNAINISNSSGKAPFQVQIASQIWYPIIIMIVQTTIYMSLVMILDNLKFKLRDRQNLQQQNMKGSKSQDLVKEKEKIEKLVQAKPILVDTLYKKYPNGYVAIRDNSFVIDKEQTFGLLGPNGAGKSTTFNILTAAIPKTHGSVRLNGQQVNRAVDDIFSTVGVCPQFNPIYDQLTTQEHIEFFAGIKGLEGQQRTDIINFYISNLQLQEYRNVQSGKLSGGNKRKLCVAMALIGNPTLLFLDEPSAGVDPIARRYLWNVLHSSASKGNGRSIVMTTHSINQAQSLCDRIGILIKGEFYCIDTPMQLKKRYGKGYRATVRCQTKQKLVKVQQAIKSNFSDFKQQKFEQDLKLCFQFSKQNFVFSRAFQLLYNKLTKEQIVYQFEIAETTLEEVFIYLSKLQGESDELPPKEAGHFCCWERTAEGCFCIC